MTNNDHLADLAATPVRAGIQQAQLSEKSWRVLMFEAIFIAVFTGFLMKSWGGGIFTFLGIMMIVGWISSASLIIRQAAACLFAFIWSAFSLLFLIGAEPLTQVAVPTFVGSMGYGIHYYAFLFQNDIQQAQ